MKITSKGNSSRTALLLLIAGATLFSASGDSNNLITCLIPEARAADS